MHFGPVGDGLTRKKSLKESFFKIGTAFGKSLKERPLQCPGFSVQDEATSFFL
jgi:hypothetical protein